LHFVSLARLRSFRAISSATPSHDYFDVHNFVRRLFGGLVVPICHLSVLFDMVKRMVNPLLLTGVRERARGVSASNEDLADSRLIDLKFRERNLAKVRNSCGFFRSASKIDI